MNLFDPEPKCRVCEDRGWVQHPQGGMTRCAQCRTDTFQPIRQVAERLGLVGVGAVREPPLQDDRAIATTVARSRLQAGLETLDPKEHQVLAMIRERDETNPIKIREIMEVTNLDERAVKGVCRTLRDTYLLPIGASRKPPAGIYWIRTKEAFLSYYETTRSQALSELTTLGKMCRKHFPELAGQLKLF